MATPTWVDFESTSVMNLDGSDPQQSPSAVPRLIVSREGADSWTAFAVTTAEPMLRIGNAQPGRSEAKRMVVSSLLRALHEAPTHRGYAELLAAQPLLEELRDPVF